MPDSFTSQLAQRWQQALQQRLQNGNLRRTVPVPAGLLDYSSNDYLSLARHPLHAELTGSTGARLVTGAGTQDEAAELEQWLAAQHQAEAALVYHTGYLANLGLMSCLATRHDAWLYDASCHASMRDGMRLSLAPHYPWRHNDLEDLETKLLRLRETVTGQIFIVAESIYSMDGDAAPLLQLVQLCRRHRAALVLDEAHALGVVGPLGLADLLGVQHDCIARVIPFGKAAGLSGGAVLVPALLREYLVNFSSPFIYTTALPHGMCRLMQQRHQAMRAADEAREQLTRLKTVLDTALAGRYTGGAGCIYNVPVPGNAAARRLEAALAAKGYHTKAMLHPTVPAGSEMIRLCLHAHNTENETLALAAEISLPVK